MVKKEEVLYLNIKGEYYDEIESGTKVVEYRDRKPYYDSRFKNRHYTHVVFINGYSPTARRMCREIVVIKKTKFEYEIYLGKKCKLPDKG